MYDWTGFYIDGNVGAAWVIPTLIPPRSADLLYLVYFNCGNLAVVEASGTGSLSTVNATSGVQAGYNWQAANWVFGAEVDSESLRLHASNNVTSAYAGTTIPFTTSTSIGTDWLFTARGRLGWTATPQLLLYATGGLALSRITVTNAFQDSAGAVPAASSSSSDRAGWTVGGGAEWMFAPHWTIRAEYLYIDLGHISTTANVTDPTGLPVSPLTSSFHFTTQIARAGINYKF